MKWQQNTAVASHSRLFLALISTITVMARTAAQQQIPGAMHSRAKRKKKTVNKKRTHMRLFHISTYYLQKYIYNFFPLDLQGDSEWSASGKQLNLFYLLLYYKYNICWSIFILTYYVLL